MRFPGHNPRSSFLVEHFYSAVTEFGPANNVDLGLFSNRLFFLCLVPDIVVMVSSICELRRSCIWYRDTYGVKWKPRELHHLSTVLASLTLLAYFIETLGFFGVTSLQWVPVVLVIACSGVRSVQIIVFLLASAQQGEFVVMIMTIMFQDMPQFMMITTVLTFAFSQIFMLVQSLVSENLEIMSVSGSLHEFWKMLFGNFKHVFGNGFEDGEKCKNASASESQAGAASESRHIALEISSLIAALLITIVLVNMLIASMGETFQRVRGSKERE
jgi:hypothetical protein